MDSSLLALFPLNVVLFPETLLPLHIFEERYRQLLAECLDQDLPFGVVLLKEGYEVGGPALPYRVGTTARIRTHSVRKDGHLNLVVCGERRFRIRALDSSLPYLRAATEWLDDRPEEHDLSAVASTACKLFERHVELLFEVIGHPAAHLSLPRSPQKLSYFISARLRVSLLEKQELLEMTSTEQRLGAIVRLLVRRNATQEAFLPLRPSLGPVHSDIAVLLDAYLSNN
jgi:Lon protease-like protein